MDSSQNRIEAVDLLRGFALLGILVMNLASFALPTGSYYNPLSFEPTLLNRVVHGVSHIIADQKMMAIFSMLFGASMILLMEKTEAAGRKFGSLHYARSSWLLLFGFLHTFFLWNGDILALYAFCAFALYLFRRWPSWLNLVLGLLIFLAPVAWAPWMHGDLAAMNETEQAAVNKWWAPPAEIIAEDIRTQRGGYGAQLAQRLEEFGESEIAEEAGKQTAMLLALEAFCRVFGMMLLGIALYRWDILTGRRSRVFYQRMMILGFGLGLPAAAWGLRQYHAHGFRFDWSLSLGRVPNHFATILMAGGAIAMIMLWSRSERLAALRRRTAAMGRMALSNYIGQTILATALFHGWGLGLYARLNRLELLGVMVLFWILQLLFSPWWLARFRYGPLEWLWRSLSYWAIVPIRD